MVIVTDIAPQKRIRDRVNVYLDGEYAFSLAIVTAGSIRIGQSLSSEDIEKLQASDAFERAKQSAFHFLSFRPRSSGEVRKNLAKKGYDDSVVDRVIDRLLELELLDDRAFAQYWVEQRETFKPRSKRALRYEMYQKGLSREVIDQAVADVDEMAAARRSVAKKAEVWSRLGRDSFRSKIVRYLKNRGFNYQIIADVSQELWETVHTGDEQT